MAILSASDIPTFKWGMVTRDNPLQIKLDGDTSPLALIPDAINGSYLVGDRVRVELSKNRVVVHGSASRGVATNLTTQDLDTINYTGSFVQKLNANATTARHYPAARAGYLMVIGDRSTNTAGGGYQRYVDYSDPRRVWGRNRVGGAWNPWVLENDASGPSTMRTFASTYWRQWFDTDTQKMMIGDNSGGWRQFAGSVSLAARAWDTTQGASGQALVAGRTDSFNIPTVLEPWEDVFVFPRSVGSGFGIVTLNGITRNPTNTSISIRFMQLASHVTQPLNIGWQISPSAI